MYDEAALTAAFEGAEAAFVLLPPNFDPEPGFPEARVIGTATRNALVHSNISKVVYLSTIGALAVCVILFLVAEKQRIPVPHISFGDRLRIARCLSPISCFNAIPQRIRCAGMNASLFPFMLPSRGRREKPYARFPQRIPGCSDA
jgi:hypothetical protein